MASWYLQLAREEGLDPKSVVLALAQALVAASKEAAQTHHMAKRIDDLEQPLLTVRQVATILNRNEETIRRYARDRVISSIDIPGGAILFDKKILLEELNSFLRRSKFSD